MSLEVDTILSVSSERILDSPWLGDLDPAAVPFRTPNETVLRRADNRQRPDHIGAYGRALMVRAVVVGVRLAVG